MATRGGETTGGAEQGEEARRSTSTTTPAARLLRQRLKHLRRDNATRWKQLTEVWVDLPEDEPQPHNNMKENDEEQPSSTRPMAPGIHQSTTTLSDRLRVELELLPQSQWAVASDRMLRHLLSDVEQEASSSSSTTTTTTAATLPPQYFDATTIFAKDVAVSYRATQQLVEQLQMDVTEEENRLSTVQAALQEAMDLKSELELDLAETERTAQRQVELELSLLLHHDDDDEYDNDNDNDNDNNSDHHHHDHSHHHRGDDHHSRGSKLQRQLDELYSDLKYVCHCLEQRHGWDRPVTRRRRKSNPQEDPCIDPPWSLETLIHELINRLLQSPGDGTLLSSSPPSRNDLDRTTPMRNRSRSRSGSGGSWWSEYPYLSIDHHPVRLELVEFLTQNDLVQVHENDDALLQLLDYRR